MLGSLSEQLGASTVVGTSPCSLVRLGKRLMSGRILCILDSASVSNQEHHQPPINMHREGLSSFLFFFLFPFFSPPKSCVLSQLSLTTLGGPCWHFDENEFERAADWRAESEREGGCGGGGRRRGEIVT